MADFALPPETIQQAIGAIANSTRTHDTICPLTNRVLLLLLRDTEAEGADAVAARIRDELALRNNGHHRWRVLPVTHIEQFGSTEALTLAILRMTSAEGIAA